MRERLVPAGIVIAMIKEFGLDEEEIVSLLYAQDMPTLKKRIKERWHQLAFQLHPDRGGDENAFKRLSAIYTDVMQLQPAAPPRIEVQQPVINWVEVRIYGAAGGYTNTASTGTWTTGNGFW